jgi:hypothetical protein
VCLTFRIIRKWKVANKWHGMSQPYFGQVWGWSPTLGKSEDLESSETPECLEFDSKAQNTSHWGILGVIGKVLERRYRKWPRIGHLDICSPSYGQKKGRESNWHPTTKSRESTSCRHPIWECDTSLERSRQGLQLWFRPCRVVVGSYELPKPRDSTRDNFGTISRLQLGSPRKKSHLDVASVESCREYYKGEGGGFPRVRAMVCLVVRSARGLSQHPRVSCNVN